MPQYNPNLIFLQRCFSGSVYDTTKLIDGKFKKIGTVPKKTGVSLEGSSRSAKTWSSVDFLIWYCASRKEAGKVIKLIKETKTSFETTLYDDFNRRLPMFGLDSPFKDKQRVNTFDIYGNKFHLLGADDDAKIHGSGCDVAYFNEVLDIPKAVFDQTEMRCREFWLADYNPKATEHYWYDTTDEREDVGKLKTTYKDNPHISPNEKRKIESYQSIRFSKIAEFFKTANPKLKEEQTIAMAKAYSLKQNINKFPVEDCEELERCILNEKQRTADDYMWCVYGRGDRSAPEGLVFQNVTYVNEFPSNCEKVYYGLDFGYTIDPTALVKVGILGRSMFVQCLHYAPTPTFTELRPVLELVPKGNFIWADPSGEHGERFLITQSQKNGFKVYAAPVKPGTILFGISLMKDYHLHFIDSPPLKKEQTNYKYRIINGIKTGEPLDAYNHAIDATRYACLANIRK